jgi:hypothetical protein
MDPQRGPASFGSAKAHAARGGLCWVLTAEGAAALERSPYSYLGVMLRTLAESQPGDSLAHLRAVSCKYYAQSGLTKVCEGGLGDRDDEAAYRALPSFPWGVGVAVEATQLALLLSEYVVAGVYDKGGAFVRLAETITLFDENGRLGFDTEIPPE